MSAIYLDSNIYLSIARRESIYEYTLAKINNLCKNGILFPHSPAHAEEIAARLLDGREVDITRRFKSLVSRFNGRKGYFPGSPNIKETEGIIFELECAVAKNPALHDAIAIHKKNLQKMRVTVFDKSRLRARVEPDDFEDCIRRVQKYLNLTDVARKNDRFHLGRRTKKSLEENFYDLNISTENVETFDESRKKYKLEPRRLANVPTDKIFQHEDFVKFAKNDFSESGASFDNVPKGNVLRDSFYKTEGAITLALNCLEKAGYFQEDKNHASTLSGRMFDVTHAIYATGAEYFVTNDFRFAKKTAATYFFLEIPTKVIVIDDFVNGGFLM